MLLLLLYIRPADGSLFLDMYSYALLCSWILVFLYFEECSAFASSFEWIESTVTALPLPIDDSCVMPGSGSVALLDTIHTVSLCTLHT